MLHLMTMVSAEMVLGVSYGGIKEGNREVEIQGLECPAEESRHESLGHYLFLSHHLSSSLIKEFFYYMSTDNLP